MNCTIIDEVRGEKEMLKVISAGENIVFDYEKVNLAINFNNELQGLGLIEICIVDEKFKVYKMQAIFDNGAFNIEEVKKKHDEWHKLYE